MHDKESFGAAVAYMWSNGRSSTLTQGPCFYPAHVGNKQRKQSETAGAAPSQLVHNPFASLQGRLDLASAAPPVSEPPSSPEPAPEPARKRSLGRLVQRRETKHRGGKAVIVITGFAALTSFNRTAVEQLAKELKAKLGCGGTVEDTGKGLELVIQGDQAKKVAELLRAKGFRVDGVVV